MTDSINSIQKEAWSPDSADAHSVAVEDYIAETRPWYKVKHLRWLTFMIFLITLTSTNNGYDGSMLNGLQSLEHWQKTMGHPTGKRLGHLSNGATFGGIAALPIIPYLSDHYGRKKLVIVGQTLAVVGGILQGASTGYGFFLGARILLGFGTMVAVVPSPPLISEISYPTHRATCTFAYNICWYLGAIIASWVTFGTRTIKGKASWSIPSYLQVAMPAFQLALFWLVPESPRYLVAQGRVDEAKRIIAKYHTGDSKDPRDMALVDFEVTEIQCALEAEKLNTNASYSDFITKKSFRRRLFLVSFIPVMMQLSGNGLVSYYLVKVLISIGIKSTKKQLEINGCLMIYNFVICASLASTVRWFKRRTLFLSCCAGMLLTYVIWTILSALNQERDFKDKSLANGVLAMIFLYYLFYDIGNNGLPYLYLTEVLPYSHRTKGINIMQFWIAGILIYNGYVNPIAMDAIEWKYYIVYCCVLAGELIIVYFTFPETSGYTLEEVAQVFGDEPPELNKRHADNALTTKQSMEHVEDV
ncbi:putative lactose permease [Clavispora lusitaniae]|uniref:Lactose permease n=1 Tax=Clavispora lusitaniae TaxID=36911 RepID=A0ACD0WFL5_CLALS|nr:MFS transporter, sugar porter (SP) family protein [Clavispora lusitaniae]QFZ26080.1 putative lactose permease [Clavispora lusitaniae]QFZ30617.1 putative lactose permease [Clavispora lusitaniae]QFZ36285.1 putative lactose permease [Clavispora lusitaniae]QFZ41969.1 putative lactose permease [Clavispora lusitaniae]